MLNNPLKNTDPSGGLLIITGIIAATVAGTYLGGSLLFGDSGKWLYYSGEVFYRKAIEEDQYLEFDAFAVEDRHVSTFAS